MTYAAAAIRAALPQANAKAFLRLIRERESGQDDAAYRIINGGARFEAPPWVHPWPDGTPTTQGGRASGAYQFLPSTWAGLERAYPEDCSTFDPAAQDFGALALIAERGALPDVLAGRLAEAVRKLRPVWTSLPGASESSSAWTMDKARQCFIRWGGSLAAGDVPTQPAAPIEEAGRPIEVPTGGGASADKEAPVLPLIVPFVLSLAQAFIQPKIAQTLTKQGAAPGDAAAQAGNMTAAGTALLSGIVDSAVKHSGKAEEVAQAQAAGDELAAAKAQIDALMIARADAEKRAAVEADANALLDKLKPLVDQLDAIQRAEWDAEETSRDRASERALREPWDMTRTLVYAGIGFLLLVTIAVFALYGIALWTGKPVTQFETLMVQIVTAVIGIFLSIIAYRFGTSRSSAAKDELVAQLSARRPRAIP